MGNLVRPAKRIGPINTVDANTLKLYDSNTKILIEGLGIILDSEKLDSFTQYCTTSCVPRVELIKVKPTCPCNDCDLEFGISVVAIPRHTGFVSDYTPKTNYYNTVLSSIQACSSGYLAAADILIVRNDLVKNIMKDKNKNIIGIDYKGVYAGVARKFTGWTNAATVTVDGTTYGAQATIAAFIASINAGTLAYAFLDETTPATVFWVVSRSTTGIFTSLSATTASLVAEGQDATYMATIAVDCEKKYQIAFDSSFGTKTAPVAGTFGILTTVQLQREFAVLRGDAGMNKDYILPSTDYCKYIFKFRHDAYDVSAANHSNTYVEEVVLYIKEDQAHTANFDGKLNDWALADGTLVISPSLSVS